MSKNTRIGDPVYMGADGEIKISKESQDKNPIGWQLPNNPAPVVSGASTNLPYIQVGQPQPIIPVSTGVITPEPNLSVMDLAKALRECFAQSNGKIPCGPLDELIDTAENPVGVMLGAKSGYEEAMQVLDALYAHAAIDDEELKEQVRGILDRAGRLA